MIRRQRLLGGFCRHLVPVNRFAEKLRAGGLIVFGQGVTEKGVYLFAQLVYLDLGHDTLLGEGNAARKCRVPDTRPYSPLHRGGLSSFQPGTRVLYGAAIWRNVGHCCTLPPLKEGSMKKLLSLCAIFASFGASAHAQQADPVAALPICTLEGNRANCTSLGSSIFMPGGLSGFVPISDFATAQQAASLTYQTNLISAGVAMSGALDFQSPQDGRDNRLGGGVATFNDQTALGVTYTRRAGPVDLNFGIATSNYQNFAKASVGFSW